MSSQRAAEFPGQPSVAPPKRVPQILWATTAVNGTRAYPIHMSQRIGISSLKKRAHTRSRGDQRQPQAYQWAWRPRHSDFSHPFIRLSWLQWSTALPLLRFLCREPYESKPNTTTQMYQHDKAHECTQRPRYLRCLFPFPIIYLDFGFTDRVLLLFWGGLAFSFSFPLSPALGG